MGVRAKSPLDWLWDPSVRLVMLMSRCIWVVHGRLALEGLCLVHCSFSSGASSVLCFLAAMNNTTLFHQDFLLSISVLGPDGNGLNSPKHELNQKLYV